jgi:alkylated DNA nucleotide flippase Atl1
VRLNPASPFVAAVLEIVDSIPAGRVMTYGDIAANLGSRAARVVGQTMAQFGSESPWWRVVRAGGHPPVGHEKRALAHYRSERTPLLLPADPAAGYRVDLGRARWSPDPVREP